jgi:ribosomal protein S27AE
LNYLTPEKSKFWTLKDSLITTKAKMCARCGAVVWFGDLDKLAALRTGKALQEEPSAGDPKAG